MPYGKRYVLDKIKERKNLEMLDVYQSENSL